MPTILFNEAITNPIAILRTPLPNDVQHTTWERVCQVARSEVLSRIVGVFASVVALIELVYQIVNGDYKMVRRFFVLTMIGSSVGIVVPDRLKAMTNLSPDELRRQMDEIDRQFPTFIPKDMQGPKGVTHQATPRTDAIANEIDQNNLLPQQDPQGVFEMPHFAEGTKAIATKLANSHAKTIIGGGDSVAAVQQMGLGNKFFHLSTGGGASLEFLELGHLPGIDALSEK